MITLRKLAIYREFDGKVDYWQIIGRPKGNEIKEADWYEIMNLLQEATLLKKNLANKEYSEQIHRKISEATADKETFNALLEMA
jgi:hypothetical protein